MSELRISLNLNRVEVACCAVLAIVVLVWSVVRFVGLDQSPPGFYYDESSNATHLICLAEQGTDANGNPHPFFATQFEPAAQTEAGLVPPTFLYAGALWVKIFGHSIAAIRAMSAFFVTIAICGLFFLGRALAGTGVGLFTVVAATLSPWFFQFSRFSSIAPIDLALLVWGCFFALRSPRRRDAVVAGLLLSAAMYTYPPARVQIALLLLPLLVMRKQLLATSLRGAWALLATLVVTALPLVVQSFSPENLKRVGYVGIFSKTFIDKQPPGSTYAGIILQAFSTNMWAHFSPTFLFFSGDENPRHSIQHFGELGWIGTAVVLAAAAVVLTRVARNQPLFGSSGESTRLRHALFFATAGFLTGIAPAALTWEKVPHAMRGIGAAPFLALVIGLLLPHFLNKYRQLWQALPVVALAYSCAYFSVSFLQYPSESAGMWTTLQGITAETASRNGNWSEFARVAQGLPHVSSRYFLVEYGGQSCESSDRRLTELLTAAMKDK